MFCSLASSIDSLLAATSDLVTNDLVGGWLRPGASDSELRRTSVFVVLGLGLFTWLVAFPNVGTLATVLFFAGPLVGSAIWPILLGLYSRRPDGATATAAMLLGSAVGLAAYTWIGWYTGVIFATAVSLLTCLVGLRLRPHAEFEWARLAHHRSPTPA